MTINKNNTESSDEMPIVTVITVVYNGGVSLLKTVESVLKHKTKRVEYILIDGGSTDNSLCLIEPYMPLIDCFISEKDSGIYDAMNKAVLHAKGEFLLNINCGDILLHLPLDELNRSKEFQLVAASVSLSDGSLFKPFWGITSRFTNTLHHQGLFYRREVTPLYDLKYRVYSDYDLNSKIISSGGDLQIINQVVAYHSMDGISHSSDKFKEVYSIVKKYNGFMGVFFAFIYFKIMGMACRFRRAQKLIS